MKSEYRIYDETGDSRTEKNYSSSAKKKSRILIVSVVVIVALLIVTLVWGNSGYSVGEIFGAFFGFDTESTIGRFVWLVDMPIFVAALVVGGGLALAGLVMQSVLRNPLASPYTLGISGAAAFGAAFSIIYFNSGLIFSGFMSKICTPLCAFLFSMIATGLIIVLMKLTKISPETMVLGGIAISAIFSAGLTLMQYLADPSQLNQIVSWTFGSLTRASWRWDGIIAIALIAVATYFVYNRWNLNAIETGDDSAKGLGLNTERFIIISMVLSSFLTAILVSQFGVIAFVGLLAPHMARIIIGNEHGYLIPMSVLCGMILMAIANMVALNITAPMVLPVGLLTSLLGGPTFVYLLIRRYRSS